MTAPAVRRAAAPLAVAVLVLAVVLGVTRLFDPPGSGVGGAGAGPGGPPVLRLAGWVPVGQVELLEPDPRYILAGALPDGPAEARVYAVPGSSGGAGGADGAVSSDTALAALAAALVSQPPTIAEDGTATVETLPVDVDPGAAYPLVTARDAWDAYVRTPRPVPLMACPQSQDDSAPTGCAGGPATVTGARLGLSLQWSAGEALLVPAWLFDVEGADQPLVQVAVDPAYVVADDSGGGTGGSIDSGGSTGGSPGTVTPEPGVAPPPADRMTRFTSVTAAADGRSLAVTFWGGVEDCYGYQVRAEEAADVVELTLQERSRHDGPCIELAQEYTRTVALRAPLGDRPVLDAATGETLLGG